METFTGAGEAFPFASTSPAKMRFAGRWRRWARAGVGDHVTHPSMKANLAERILSMEPLEAEDVDAVVAYAIAQPARVSMNEILLWPTGQER